MEAAGPPEAIAAVSESYKGAVSAGCAV